MNLIETTIKEANYSGKWMEFWFEEGDILDGESPSFHACSKNYKFWEAADKAGLEKHILNQGVKGLKITWEKEGMNHEIHSIKK